MKPTRVRPSGKVVPIAQASQEFGLPEIIRTDNGPPFASTGLGGLTDLSVRWIELGIVPERIRPGKPQDNGQHDGERPDLELYHDRRDARPCAYCVIYLAEHRKHDWWNGCYHNRDQLSVRRKREYWRRVSDRYQRDQQHYNHSGYAGALSRRR